MHKNLPVKLVSLLADNQYHSGVELGKALSITRAAVWKQIQGLQELGLGIESRKGKGYRLVEMIDVISKS